ncbi:MAG: hypothetical protein KJN61_01145 [Gammaproteobacteria bacterium]|nr:hypothetical protein [Gammaproteobacteria bacterium]NNL00030.1 SPOR domain-containing protein [Xanthomonadales bacterium]
MLRIFVISLVVANLLLFGFQSSQPTAPEKTRPSQVAAVDAEIPTIHLFSEMLEDQELIDGKRRCFSVGPFHSIEERDAMYDDLVEIAENVNERQTQALIEKGYWVFMPPYDSRLEANEALLSLQALGLQDISVTYSGAWENAISLGYFMRQENATRRQRDLEKRGYSPMVRVQRLSESRYWLDYEQRPGSGLIALDMQDRPNDFSSRPTPCPEQGSVASKTDIAQNDSSQVQVQASAKEQTLPLSQQAGVEPGDSNENLPAAEAPAIQVEEPEETPVEQAEEENGSAAEGVTDENSGLEAGVADDLEAIPEVEIEVPLNEDSVPGEETGAEDDIDGE